MENLTKEQIEQLAMKQLEERDEWELEIKKIDKDYKKNNKNIISYAIGNASMIILLTGVFFSSDLDLTEFGTERAITLIDELSNWLGNIMDDFLLDDKASIIFMKLMNILEIIIDRIGIVGVVLANRAISLITNVISKGIKSDKMKKEIEKLKLKIAEVDKIKEEGKER